MANAAVMRETNSHHLLPRTAATMPQPAADRWSRMYGTRQPPLSTLNSFMQTASATYDNSQAAMPDTPHLLTLKLVAFEAASIGDQTFLSYGEVKFGTEPIGTGALLPRAPRLNGKAQGSAVFVARSSPEKSLRPEWTQSWPHTRSAN